MKTQINSDKIDNKMILSKTITPSTLVSSFHAQASSWPKKIAIKTPQNEITYQDLDAFSNALACQLRLLLGDRQARVGLFLEHGINMQVAILGVLKAGYVYVPLDMHHPVAWLNDILEMAEIEYVVHSNVTSALALNLVAKDFLNIDYLKSTDDKSCPLPVLMPDNIAYLLFTSGSTGKPKGVMQSHHNVLHHIKNYTNMLNITSQDKLLQFASYGFDAGVIDSYSALLNGACLCLSSVQDHDFAAICHFAQQAEVTIYHSTPTVYRVLLSGVQEKSMPKSIRAVVLGGEEVYLNDLGLFKKHFNSKCAFINLLGSTECSFTMACQINNNEFLPKEARIPVGHPVEGIEAVILDEYGKPTEGTGELAYRSRYLALGYWKQPDLTNKVFSNAPLDESKRLYLTGDLACRLDNGQYMLLGRKDKQVKIRGNRVDTAHIVWLLRGYPDVLDAVILISGNDGSEKKLIAYVKVNKTKLNKTFCNKLKAFLRERLPDYMVPAELFTVEDFPLNTHGKIDRLKLNQILVNQQSMFLADKANSILVEKNSTELERQVAEIFHEELGCMHFSKHDHYFALGGNSLSAIKLLNKLNTKFNARLNLVLLYQESTVAKLANYLAQNCRTEPAILNSVIEEGEL